MKFLKLPLIPCVLLIVAASFFFRTGATHAATLTGSTPHITCGQWNVVSSPHGVGNNNVFEGVAAISDSDVWAVGFTETVYPHFKTLTEHWNGTVWSIVPSPNGNKNIGTLDAVVEIASNDVWTVGTVIEHWDGATWTLVAKPAHNGVLSSITAISANDIWTVGTYYDSQTSTTKALTEHYDGTTWVEVHGANPSTVSNVLYSVTAIASNNVWAIGYFYRDDPPGSPDHQLIEHWDGTKWRVVSSFFHASYSPDAIAGDAANDIWAVGSQDTGDKHISDTFTENWNGTTWNPVPSPTIDRFDNLFGLTVISANNVWAVGRINTYNNIYNALIEHWDGTAWTIVKSKNPGAIQDTLYSITAVPGSGHLWAVGDQADSSSRTRPLVEYYC